MHENLLPADVVAQLSQLGHTFFVNGLVLVVPPDAPSKAVWAAAELLDRIGQDRYQAETADSGGT